MSITTNTKVYAPDVASSPNSMPYLGPLHTFDTVDKFDLYRTAPKPTKVMSGVARARAKLSRTLALTGALTTHEVAIVDLNVSVPVGAASADIDALVSDAVTAFAQAWMNDLVKKQDLSA